MTYLCTVCDLNACKYIVYDAVINFQIPNSGKKNNFLDFK